MQGRGVGREPNVTPENFVTQVRSAIIADNMAIYKSLFTSTAVSEATDPYWKRALTLFGTLNEADRAVLFEVIRQTMVDTVSNVLGVLDGSSTLGTSRENFVLTTKTDVTKLNGDLQDLFLAEEELSGGR